MSAGVVAPAERVRARIARCWLGESGDAQLGRVALRPHQRFAADRLRALIDAHGGALLADPVGLGKTFTALAVARGASRPAVVAPASLRDMWRNACTAADVQARIVSFHALSRGRATVDADFLIVDEAHHVRNPHTARYRELARLCARHPVLLLTATPVHNRMDDLRAELALFLGGYAWTAPEHALRQYVVRRDGGRSASDVGLSALPRAGVVRWVETADDSRVLDRLERLPAPLPIRDAGDGGALVAVTLVRQWASSRAALTTALRRRLAQARALAAALAADRHPSRRELRAWCFADGAMQLAFPELAADARAVERASLLEQTERHAAAVVELLHRASAARDPDDDRAAAIRDIARRHAGKRVIVFAEFSETVRALYARLQHAGGVAMLTDRGAVVAGGRLTRRELLAQFEPGAGTRTPQAQRVMVLITTDLLSEGVNLQDAAVIVHADLPWSPARFEQRVGRVRRLHSPHDEVYVYAFRPPARAERLLRMERRLRRKLAAAARVVGLRGLIVPRLFPGAAGPARPAAEAEAEILDLVGKWRRADVGDDGTPTVGAVRASRSGFVAVIDVDGRPRLVARLEHRIADDAPTVRDALRQAAGADAIVDPADAEAALAEVSRWCERRSALDVCDIGEAAAARSRRRLLHRIDAIAARAPRHLRPRYGPLARDARRVATAAMGTAAERVLEDLASAPMPDDAWLNAVGTFARLHAPHAPDARRATVQALLLLVSTSRASEAAAPPP